MDAELKASTVAIVKLAPDNTEMSPCTHTHMFFLYETISIYKTKFQETKALFGVSESVEYETLQGCIPSHGNVTKVKKMRYDDQWNTFHFNICVL